MKTIISTFAVAVLVMANGATAVEQNSDADRIAQLEAKVAQLQAQSQDSWLNERRTQEVKALVREVLSDADTRASLAEGGMTAGHNGKHFFLASEDGSFLMNIEGQIQFRWLWNSRDGIDNDSEESDVDGNETGFVIRRTKLAFSGHIGDPKLHYMVQLEVGRSDNSVAGDIITIAYDLTDTLTIKVGEDKAPFLREELISSKRQLAVERSLVNELFTLDVVQGIFLDWDPHEQVHVAVALSDGGRSGEPGSSADSSGSVGRVKVIDLYQEFTTDPDDPGELTKDFHNDGTDFAITARVDVLLAGDWSQGKDFTAWPGEELFVQIGAAVHYEVNESGDTEFEDNDPFLMWTIDASVEYKGFNLYIAYMMAHTDFEETGGASYDNYDPWGLVVQGGYNIDIGNGDSVEPFIRYETVDFDGAVDDGNTYVDSDYEDQLELLTFGVNWYHKKHAAKFTADIVWCMDAIDSEVAESGLGILGDITHDQDDQFVVRLQYQLLF